MYHKRLLSTLALAVLIAVTVYATLPKANEAQAQQNYGLRTLSFNGITTTTRSCASFPLSDVAYVQLFADVTVANTSTVDVLSSNNATNYTTGSTLSATVTTDTPTIASGNLYTVSLLSVDTCIRVTPTNTNPITITAIVYAPLRAAR